jgi:hypothetical protein
MLSAQIVVAMVEPLVLIAEHLSPSAKIAKNLHQFRIRKIDLKSF